jgi:hypothetical protein
MSKPKDSQPEVIFSQKAENNYNLEDKKKKLKAMKSDESESFNYENV